MTRRQLWQRFIAHIDRPLLLGISLLLATSLLVMRGTRLWVYLDRLDKRAMGW